VKYSIPKIGKGIKNKRKKLGQVNTDDEKVEIKESKKFEENLLNFSSLILL